jgi:hypothetical protein
VQKRRRRAIFTLPQDLRQWIENFIAYFKRTLAEPFRWTKTGKSLIIWTMSRWRHFFQQGVPG